MRQSRVHYPTGLLRYAGNDRQRSAQRRQHVRENRWMPHKDSNLDKRYQKPVSYH